VARYNLSDCTFQELDPKHELTDPLLTPYISGHCGAVILQISEIMCWNFDGKKHSIYGQEKEALVKFL